MRAMMSLNTAVNACRGVCSDVYLDMHGMTQQEAKRASCDCTVLKKVWHVPVFNMVSASTIPEAESSTAVSTYPDVGLHSSTVRVWRSWCAIGFTFYPR